MTNQQPELEVRRAMLVQMRDNLRAQGFEAETNVTVLSVQSVRAGDKDAQSQAIADLKAKAQNCYRGAEELSLQLSKLPKPKKAKA
jgi:hypothetical protein